MEYVALLGKVLPYLKLLLYQLRPYEIRVGELTKGVNKLRKERKRVQNKVREEEKRNRRAIDDDVIKWLEEVDGLISEYDNFWEDEDRPYAVCSHGYLPKPSIRYRLSSTVNDLTRRANVLLQTAKHDGFSYWLGTPSFDADFDNIRYEMFESRNQTMADILAALADSNVEVIGVYGWNGVGKTSLIKEVAKEVKGNMFDEVIMANVTSCPDIRSIQGQIADRLGLKLEEESESGRAACLRGRIKNPKEKTLIILDNMGVKLDFNMLGIPSENNDGSQMNHKMKNLSAHHRYAMKAEEFDGSSLMKTEEPLARYKGCKILMISDSEQLLLSQMDGKRIQTFCVKALREKEAETMFKNMAEIGDGNSMLETLAAQISKKCRGLPLTIVTTANALKNKSLLVWEDAYRKLERQNLTAVPEFSTKLSYELLEDEELKYTFLICARMNHDALMTDLVRYCIGVGLLQGFYTVKEARDRVHVLVGKLKELSLLSDSFSSDRFTMQDIVREAALSISFQETHAFALTKCKLDEWPDIDKLERYTSISLHHCDLTDIMREFPQSLNCSRLRVFHLDNKDPLLEIPDNFFNGMKELRALMLIGIHLSSLPSSIECLKKLRMLCLEGCKLAENLSIIGELEKLRVLSLSGSDIDKLPVELCQLTRLQILDISDCFKLKIIPAHVLSSLTGLEEFYVRNSPIQWIDEGQGNASLSELRHLNQLTTLDIQIPKITHLPKNLFFDKLDSYRIIISEYFDAYPVWDFKMLEMSESSRYLALHQENGFDIHHQKEIKILFGRVENLLLGQLNDVEDIFYELNYEGFPYLKYLSIVSNSKVKSIINSKNLKHPEKAFPKLESLFLYEVTNMEHICQIQLTHDSFCKLKIIKLKICGQLKNVFFCSMIKHLSALETMEVSECNSLKEIVTLERDKTDIIDKIKFPELRSLTLQSLPEFIGFYTDDASTSEQVPNRKPNELFDEKVVISKLERVELSSIKIKKIWNDQPFRRSNFENLIHLDVNDCWNLQYLMSLSMSKSLMNLQSLSVSECGNMDSIFVGTEASMIEIEEGIFPKLKSINLKNMKILREIWAKFPLHSFGKLDALIIEGCNKLNNVFPSYMVGRFQSVCNLKVSDCKSMKEIFDLKDCGKPDAEDMTNLHNFHVEALPKLEHVWNKDPEGILNFKNLKNILVQECLNLKHIFPLSIAMDLEKLECLEVRNCGQLKEIVSRVETNNMSSISFEFPKLTTARFLKLPNLESFYGGTHEICCSALNNLSVELCHKLELFRKENANSEIKPVFLPEKVIYNLKSMQIDPQDADWLMTYMGNYRMHKLKEFQLSRLVDTKILYFFLHRNPNLKSLLLSNCFFEQLLPPRGNAEENLGVVPKLKCLKLMNLPSLKMIGFEQDTILFQKLECLILKECPCLNTLPSSVSFTYLTNLEVNNCNKLSYLMTTSTAKSLVQLTTMKVIQCESMETIVSGQENEQVISEKSKERLRICFKQLKEIELVALHALESFHSSFRCTFEFPLLENFVVSECGNLKSFTFTEQDKAPVLQQICDRDETEEKRYYWKGDLNATIRHMYQIRAIVPDRMETCNPYTILESSHLKTLKLVNIEDGHHAIPTIVFPGLKNLEELEVSCSNVEVIFDIMSADMKGYTIPLKKLTLYKLPMLTRVWNEDHDGFLSFQNLREVHVTHCRNLKSVFPMDLARRVEKLEKLEIRHCEKFLKVVEEENVPTEAAEEFSFPRLTSLDLRMLPQLTCFYPGKVISILESLKLDLKNTMMLCNRHFPEDMLHELVELELDFDDVSEVSNFPFDLFEKASNLEYLQISRCRGLEELFPSQPQQCEIRIPAHLTTLVHSAVSFSNLKQLSVRDCHGLKHLFTPSTARKLVHLEEMYVVNCESIEKILAKELNETASEAIKFERLNTIILDSLSSLKCFYSGSDTLQLPSLIRVLVWKCTRMKIFSKGVIHAQTFLGIQVSLDPKDDLLFHQDLNTTVKMIQRQEFFKVLDENNHELLAESQVNVAVGQQNKWLCNLGALKLDKCILPYAIPSCILPHLNNLKELEVKDSDKVEIIFDMNDAEMMETESQLKKLILHGLSKLVRVWAKNRQGVLTFQNLQEVVVNDCESLQTLFPASVAKNLKGLEKLEIYSCLKLQEIVEKEEGTAANIKQKFVFPCLKMLVLRDLPQVTYFYPETFSLECPTLSYLFVLDCDELELFQSAHPIGEGEDGGTSINTKPLISDLKLISNLEKLRLDWKHISALSSRFRSENFMEGLEYLNGISLYYGADVNKKPISPIEILQRAPNLIEMSINNGNSPEIFHAQNTKFGEDGMLGQFKTLTLENVSQLQSMESEDSSWLNTISEKIQELNVVRCPRLTALVHKVSFSCLKKVSISNCPDLHYLFPSSAAKKLMNLEEITVRECKSVKEIVAKEGDLTSEAIKFERLKTIVLNSLPSLMYFYSGSDTLHLPSLINVHIRECPNIRIFSQGVIYSESFKGLPISLDPNEDLFFHQDLNATVKGMFQRLAFLEALDEKCSLENLKEQNKWFSYLITVKLDKCILPYALPSILPPLKGLRTLEVGDSDQVEVIFDLSDTEILKTASQLKVLTLKGLSKLRNVWEVNCQEVLIFSLLEEVVVSGCENLKTLFPTSIAKSLKKLEKLEIDSCDKLLTIVEKEEGTLADARKEFIFPNLEKLELRDLPQLTYFYPETFTLECPTLNQLGVLFCHDLQLFPSTHPPEEGEGMGTSIKRLPLISDLKVISNMKSLMLDWKHILALSLWFRSEQFLEDLEHLNGLCLSLFHPDENQKPVLPIDILHKAPNLEELNLLYCNSPEIFLAQNPKIGEYGILEQLKIFGLGKIGTLNSIVSEDKSLLNIICENLHQLDVFYCPDLTTLVHSVSFSCLKKVYMYQCPNLQYLFTFSAVKKLKNLEEITVEECESLKEIMVKEGDATSEAIKFERLHTIALESLPSLICFYSGSETLHLPSLINVHVRECPNMKIFSQGVIDAESFQGIQISSDANEDLLFHQDLNTSVKGMFQPQISLTQQDE